MMRKLAGMPSNLSCRVCTPQPAPFLMHTKMPAGKFKPSSGGPYRDPLLSTILLCGGGFSHCSSLGAGGTTSHGLYIREPRRTVMATTGGPTGWEGGY